MAKLLLAFLVYLAANNRLSIYIDYTRPNKPATTDDSRPWFERARDGLK